MKNAQIQDFYVDSECTQLKKSFSVDHKRLIFEDFDLNGWCFIGFKEAKENNRPSNIRADFEPEKYYILDFYPIGDKQYTLCHSYDTDDKYEIDKIKANPFYNAKLNIGSKFSGGKRIYQIKVSEEFLQNFIKNGLYACQSLKSVITDVIASDKYYDCDQNWRSMPFMLLDDGLKDSDENKFENVLKTTMKKRADKEVKKGNLTEKISDNLKKIFEGMITKKSKLLDLYYSLHNSESEMSKEYKALLIERQEEYKVKQEKLKAKQKYKMNKKKSNTKQAASESTTETEDATETTKYDKTKG